MAGRRNRFSTYTNGSTAPGSKDEEGKKDMWSSMLDSVASGKRLPQKNLLVLGGTVESQREFIEALSSGDSRRTTERQSKSPPVANQFALGYTYYDLLDADQEDNLARISAHLLTSPSPSFAPLIAPLLTPQSIPQTLLVILVDWAEPWSWLRQLREWMLLLRTVLTSLSEDSKITMEEIMSEWKDRGRGGGANLDGTTIPVAVTTNAESDVAIPLGPGEWEDALGLPLCVVCQNAEKMEILERTQSWKEEEFDVVLQYMRTILLKHGASLIYTTPAASSQLQTLVHSSLGIHSLLKKQALKPNVIDRDKVIVPPNWDSWGKIRVLREGYDVESVSQGWSLDLDQKFPPAGRALASTTPAVTSTTGSGEEEKEEEEEEGKEAVYSNGTADDNPKYDADGYELIAGSAVVSYEEAIRNPNKNALQLSQQYSDSATLEVETVNTQEFLGNQAKILEAHKHRMEEMRREHERKHGAKKTTLPGRGLDEDGRHQSHVSDHIGPLQFNVGGIQVDADDMVQRLQDRNSYGPSPETGSPDPNAAANGGTAAVAGGGGGSGGTAAKDKNMDTENLQTFFSNLMNRRPGTKGAS